jgi:DNA-binding response OmpR family regulator
MKTIFVVGQEWSFRALLRAQLREEGYRALGLATLGEAAEALVSSPAPALLVFDTAGAAPGEIQRQLPALAARLPVLVVAGAQEEVPVRVQRLLRRPLQIAGIVQAVKELAGAAH